jgi:hypothetical protein
MVSSLFAKKAMIIITDNPKGPHYRNEEFSYHDVIIPSDALTTAIVIRDHKTIMFFSQIAYVRMENVTVG